jgi:hypothetical protein
MPAIVVASWYFHQLELPSRVGAAEQLSDRAERVELIVMHAGREARWVSRNEGELGAARGGAALMPAALLSHSSCAGLTRASIEKEFLVSG